MTPNGTQIRYLYRAAGVVMPEGLPKVLAKAKEIIPTRKPGGELIPYVGEIALKLEKGYDLILNIAPEGCMVFSKCEVIALAIYQKFHAAKPFSHNRGISIRTNWNKPLLQALGPERLYR